jgi:hypothetical protein
LRHHSKEGKLLEGMLSPDRGAVRFTKAGLKEVIRLQLGIADRWKLNPVRVVIISVLASVVVTKLVDLAVWLAGRP